MIAQKKRHPKREPLVAKTDTDGTTKLEIVKSILAAFWCGG